MGLIHPVSSPCRSLPKSGLHSHYNTPLLVNLGESSDGGVRHHATPRSEAICDLGWAYRLVPSSNFILEFSHPSCTAMQHEDRYFGGLVGSPTPALSALSTRIYPVVDFP